MFARPLHQASLVENMPPGLLLTTVSATDIDAAENGEVFYMVVNSSLVEVNSTSGEVTLASPPDYEMGETVSIQVRSNYCIPWIPNVLKQQQQRIAITV